MQKAMCMLVISKLTKLMDMEFIHMLMDLDMKDNGLTMSKRVKARKLGSTAQNTLESTKMAKNTDTVFTNGQMEVSLKEIGRKTK